MDLQISPGMAAFIVEKALHDGTLTVSKVRTYEEMLADEIASTQTRLNSLKGVDGNGSATEIVVKRRPGRPAARTAAPATKHETPAVRVRRTPTATPERARARELQGRWLGLRHKIPKSVMKREFGKDAIAKRGKEAVVADMEKYVRAHAK